MKKRTDFVINTLFDIPAMIVTDSMKRRRIFGDRVILVPYKEEHVGKYHQWMTDSDLQRLTGSEPLTLEQEYEMQKTWVRDADKCTFIVLDKSLFESAQNEEFSMIGDTNMYFTDQDDPLLGEIEVMIASQLHRGRGLGQEIALTMIKFAKDVLGAEKLVAKIKFDNEASLKLFKHLGFTETSRSEFFEEVSLLLNISRIDLDHVPIRYEFV